MIQPERHEKHMLTTFPGLGRQALADILNKMPGIRVGLLGDICLDVYWQADMRISRLSRETPHFPLPVVAERMSPGAGGNTAAGFAALGLANVAVVSAAGNDWRGNELTRVMDGLGLDTRYVIRGPRLITPAYCKPLRAGVSGVVYEDPRIDFANHAPMSAEDENALLDALDAAADDVDLLCVCDQFEYGVMTGRVRERVAGLAAGGLTVIVDSRDRIGLYGGNNLILKPNGQEGLEAAGARYRDGLTLDEYARAARTLGGRNACEVIMTVGEMGAVYAGEFETIHIPAHGVDGPVDVCGAGDAFLAGFAAAAAAGADRPQAAFVGGLCGEIVIQKIGMTGTAGREEILKRYDAVMG